MNRLLSLTLAGLLLFAGHGDGSAQNLDQILQGIGRFGQPRRATIRAEWEKISPNEIFCVDNRLRRNRRSVSTLINRGIGPTDNRVADIVNDCRADRDRDKSTVTATPSFDCRAATYQDEITICGNPDLSRLDRAVVEGYEKMISSDGVGEAKSIADPLLRRRHACGANIECIKQVQMAAIAGFQTRGAPIPIPAPAQMNVRRREAYSVAGLQLGRSVGVGSADYQEYNCSPTKQFPGFTGCQRQTAERSRRRRILESTSFLHAVDGSAVYISQNLDPVSMNENDARDEISRLSEALGKATLLPIQDAKGAPTGLIASWGAVLLQPLDPGRVAELAAGTDAQPDFLFDTVGSLQKSAQLGLPIYRLGGGAGYVWSANWNRRGRASLRMVAIDASRLPGAAVDAKPLVDPAATSPASTTSTVVTASPATEAAKPVLLPQPVPLNATQSAQKSVEIAAPEPKVPAAANSPTDVRVVGPPVALRPAAPAATLTPAPASSAGGNGLVIILIALIIGLLGVVGYLLRKSRIAPPAAVAADTARMPATPPPETSAEAPIVTKSEKMDLKTLTPAVSPIGATASPTTSGTQQADEAVATAASEVEKRA